MEQPADFARLYSQVSLNQRGRGLSLIEEADPRPGEVVLDLGCGTGDLTTHLARRVGPSGHVFAVDPDVERLEVARKSIPKELGNISYLEGRGEDLSMIAGGTIDLVYSNYAIHWVQNKRSMMRELARCLRPGGRCAFELVSTMSPFLVEVTKMSAGCGEVLLPKIKGLSERQWRDLLLQRDFMVRKAELLEVWEHFADLEAFFDWWEATTHGMFQREAISAVDRAGLAADFKGGRDVFLTYATRMVARKPRQVVLRPARPAMLADHAAAA